MRSRPYLRPQHVPNRLENGYSRITPPKWVLGFDPQMGSRSKRPAKGTALLGNII